MQTFIGRVRRKLRRSARQAGGLATSAGRALPDYLIIGTQRGGTTSLSRHLTSHPMVVRPSLKEIHYFDRNPAKSVDWYRAHFPHTKDLDAGKLTGEATPLLFHPHAAAAAAAIVPDARLIVLLRNPIERTHSGWRLQVEAGHEPLDFETAIRTEDERVAEGRRRTLADPTHVDDTYLRHCYLERGRYAEHLERWLRVFPRDQMLVLRSEDFFADPQPIFAHTLEFLGLPPGGPDEFRKANASSRSALEPATRGWLADYFRPHNERLYELLGRDMAWD